MRTGQALLRINTALLASCTFLLCAVLAGYAHSGPSELELGLERAQALEQAGQFEEALSLYRSLDRAFGLDERVQQGVRNNLERLGRYEELVPLLEQALSRSPDTLNLAVDLGRALFKTGEPQRAIAHFHSVIERLSYRPEAYTMVAGELARNREVDEAVWVYAQARGNLSTPHLFAIELARLYQWQMSYTEAARELLVHLGEHPDQLSVVEMHLYEFPTDPNVAQAVSGVLAQAARSDTTNVAPHRLLGDYLLAVGQPDSALVQYVWIAQYEHTHDQARTGGSSLFEFASNCLEQEQYQTALLAYSSLMEAFPKSRFASRSRLEMGLCLERLERFDEALEYYEGLLRSAPGGHDARDAAYRIGRIQLDVRRSPTEALWTFERLVSGAADVRSSKLKHSALLGVADALLALGRPQEAQRAYEQVADARYLPQLAERASFGLAELHYFCGDLEGAVKGWEAIPVRFPKGRLVNDALGMIAHVEQVPAGTLKLFAHAEYLGRQSRFGQATSILEEWLSASDHPQRQAPLALLLLCDLREDEKDYDQAIRACQRLIAEHPTSPLCPEAQRRMGWIYQRHLKDIDAAAEQYELVLVNYPESLLTDQVRLALKKLSKEKQ